MTTVGVNLGGAGALAPGGQPEQWMRPPCEARSADDWNDPKYATPHPAAKQKFGRYLQPILDIPQLSERNIRVRAKAPGTRYTLEGAPIPTEWVDGPDLAEHHGRHQGGRSRARARSRGDAASSAASSAVMSDAAGNAAVIIM